MMAPANRYPACGGYPSACHRIASVRMLCAEDANLIPRQASEQVLL